jgi:hypothetical protein
MTDFSTTFEEFLLWERASRDTLEVKRVYIDMAGDLVAGVVLSQIVYWHLPSRDGNRRLQVQREGELWLAKGRADWWDECRISPKQADRALEVLQLRGLIEVRLFKFGTAPTKHIRILRNGFLNAWKDQLAKDTAGFHPDPEPSPDFDQRSKSISTKGENPIRPKVKIDFPQTVKSITETTTEITTTAAAHPEKSGNEPPARADAAAALVEELVSHGVSRAAAKRFARDKPQVARRCLEYLPYAECRTTKGAWLANAIKDEFGPPPGYERAKSKRAKEEEAARRAHDEDARRSLKEARRSEKAARLREMYGRMEKSQGRAYMAFSEHMASERVRAQQVAAHLSATRRHEYLAAFDTPERRLEIFEQWLKRSTSLQSDLGPPETFVQAEGQGTHTHSSLASEPVGLLALHTG